MSLPKAPRIAKVPEPAYTLAELVDIEPDSRLEALEFDGGDGESQDLTDVTFTGCRLHQVSLHEAALTGATFAESTLTEINAPVFSAPRSSWWSTSIERSRIGSGELYDTVWRSVVVQGGKLDYLNFRYAKLTDVVFTDCIIGDLDFSHAALSRVAFKDCRIGGLRASGATMKDVDLRANEIGSITDLAALRGAAIDEYQLQLLAPAMAAELGIIVA